jgi:hypothetical protein
MTTSVVQLREVERVDESPSSRMQRNDVVHVLHYESMPRSGAVNNAGCQQHIEAQQACCLGSTQTAPSEAHQPPLETALSDTGSVRHCSCSRSNLTLANQHPMPTCCGTTRL